MNEQSNPAEIARKTLRLLASRGVAPTPQNYQRHYLEIGGAQGVTEAGEAEQALSQLAAAVRRLDGAETITAPLSAALVDHDWNQCATLLQHLLEGALSQAHLQPRPDQRVAERRAGPASTPSSEQTAPATAFDTEVSGQMLELLAKTLEFAINQDLGYSPELSAEARSLAADARAVGDATALQSLRERLAAFWHRLEAHGGEIVHMHDGLLRLLQLLIENTHELLGDDQWLRGQMAIMRDIIGQPLTLDTIAEAERRLREVIFKQGNLRDSLKDAKVALKAMVTNFIDRLGELSESTDEFHGKLEEYAVEIQGADDIAQLSTLLSNLLDDTKAASIDTARTRDELLQARQQVESAEAKVKQLETDLQQASELIRADPMTGALNRRGMDDAFEREAARADRRGKPLCVALLDVDNFKLINKQHGHQAGDAALMHLVDVVKHTMRTSDVLARYGGEEFLLLLPETSLEEGLSVMVRLQRNLTRAYYMHDNERLLITFSAGVALRRHGEPRDSVIGRADNALRDSKQAGKNRVSAA